MSLLCSQYQCMNVHRLFHILCIGSACIQAGHCYHPADDHCQKHQGNTYQNFLFYCALHVLSLIPLMRSYTLRMFCFLSIIELRMFSKSLILVVSAIGYIHIHTIVRLVGRYPGRNAGCRIAAVSFQPELSHQFAQNLCLSGKLLAGCGALLCRSRVGLHHAGDLINTDGNLRDGLCLIGSRSCNGIHHAACFLNI